MATNDANTKKKELHEELRQLANAQAPAVAEDADAARSEAEQKAAEVAEAETTQARSWINKVNVAAAVGAAVAIIIILIAAQPWDAGRSVSARAVGVALPAALVIYGLLGALRWGDGGLLSYVRGKDGRLSTSFTQVAIWTIAISAALLYFICRDFFSDKPGDALEATVGSDLPEGYLLLLGGPFAAAVLARMTVGSKVENQRLQKIETNVTRLRDVISNDNGEANLVDAQFLVFNLVALTWFIGALIDDPAKIPALPSLLVGLTSVSALGYTAAKTAESNQPLITTVTRYHEPGETTEGAEIRPGDYVEIRGVNFVPAGADSERLLLGIVVRFGSTYTTPRFIVRNGHIVSPSDNSIVARVPESASGGTLDVVVVTAAGAETESYRIVVSEDKPVITGLDPPQAKVDATITIRGRHFRRIGAAQEAKPSVKFGATPIEASSASDSELTVTVPAGLPEGPVSITVTAAGGTATSDEVTLLVLPP
jgi:hypothetical protein